MPFRRLITAILIAAVGRLATPARADDVIRGHTVDRPAEGLVIGAALGAALGLSAIPVSTARALWTRELFGEADAAVHARFSPRAAALSDAALAATVAAPVAYLTGNTIEDADGDRLMLYGEALAINLALFEGAKHLVQRPRPYLYSQLPEVRRYAAAQGKDAYQSFYSAHAATAFCAATAGAYLAATSTRSRGARAAAWGSGFASAAAASNLRVRAGKHFYSDILIGSVIGMAIGYAVPALHADGRPYAPSRADLGAAAAGVIGGGLVSQLLPLERRPAELSRGRRAWLRRANLKVGPLQVPSGAGLGIGGKLR
ncbi:MAG TPA: phosphatase PAP2 family protein [Kofleriaceae bacterium]|nr:phosphatase PAP2 family protein [Kofleriaceae bacterium]